MTRSSDKQPQNPSVAGKTLDPMIFHPHVHFVVAGGGISEDGSQWLATPANFLFPEACASPIYRQKFREALRADNLENSCDPAVWHRWWEVNVQPVGDGRAVLKYLAPNVNRVANSDREEDTPIPTRRVVAGLCSGRSPDRAPYLPALADLPAALPALHEQRP